MRIRLSVVLLVLIGRTAGPVNGQVGSAPAQSLREIPFLMPLHVDRDDPRQRLAFLAPHGPVVIEATLTIDGVPYRRPREELLDKSLQHVDADRDGRPTWAEALESGVFLLGRLPILNDQQRPGILRRYDSDGDGLVDRDEAGRFLAEHFQATFLIVRNWGASQASGGIIQSAPTNVHGVLDSDADGVLSRDEIAKSTNVLRSLDANGDEWMAPAELARGGHARRAGASEPQFAAPLGDEVGDELLFELLRTRYAKPNADFLVEGRPQLSALDADGDGRLTVEEVRSLRSRPAMLRWSADLAGRTETRGILSLDVESPLKVVERAPERAVIQCTGAQLVLTSQRRPAPLPNFEQSAQPYLDRFDKDKSGAIEQSEVNEAMRRAWRLWDTDRDGKASRAEIVESFERGHAPLLGQVRVSLSRTSDELFRRLDGNLDGRLSLRETAAAPQMLRSLDRDQDGSVRADEIPQRYSLSLAVGSYAFTIPNVGAGPAPQGDPKKVEWFRRLDRNGDGDLSIREYDGTSEQFQRLDRDADGLLSFEEAAR